MVVKNILFYIQKYTFLYTFLYFFIFSIFETKRNHYLTKKSIFNKENI